MAAKKKKTTTARRTAPAARAAARPRRRSGAMKGVAKIPKMTTAAGILAANSNEIVWVAKQSINNPRGTFEYVKAAGKSIVRPDNLAKTAKAALVGYGVGWVAKKYAPKLIKKPMAKLASKVM